MWAVPLIGVLLHVAALGVIYSAGVTAGGNAAELEALCEKAGLPFARINQPGDLYEDPHLLANGGLLPLSAGAHIRLMDGKLSLIDGPFVEAKEVVGGFAVFELRDKEEAIAMATEFMQLHKDHMPGWEGICEIRILATPPQNNPTACPQ